MPTTSAIRVEGLDRVLDRMNLEIAKIRGRTKKGLIKAAYNILRASNLKVPRDLGNLRSSGTVLWGPGTPLKSPSFKDRGGSADVATKLATGHSTTVQSENAKLPATDVDPIVEVLYSAFYALYVHEKEKNYTPPGEVKYLEKALVEEMGRTLGIVGAEVKTR